MKVRYNWVDALAFLSSYAFVSFILVICFIVGPINYINERESWETSDCICISTDSYEQDDYNYSTASFIVYWVNGSAPISTNTTGITPPIVGPPDIDIGQLYSCAIDPQSVNNVTLSVLPINWIDHWHTQIIVYSVLTALIVVILLIPSYFCLNGLISESGNSGTKISVDGYEFVRKHDEKWKNSLNNFSDAVPLNPATMFSGIVHSGSPFGSNFETAILNNNSCTSPNVDNLSIVGESVKDENLVDAVKEFYNSYELSLRANLMDWLENTGILNQVNERVSRNPSTSNYEENENWSLQTNDTTKQPLDRILNVQEPYRPVHKLHCLQILCIGCIAFGLLFFGFIGIVGYSLVAFSCNPESIGSFAFFTLFFGLEAIYVSLTFILALYLLAGNIIKSNFNENIHVAKFIANYNRVRAEGITTSLDTFLVISRKTYNIATARYEMNFVKLLFLDDTAVWYITAKPKLPKEISVQHASIFTVNMD